MTFTKALQRFVILSVAFLVGTSTPAQEVSTAQLDAKYRAFLRDYCVKCHRVDKEVGGQRFDNISFSIDSIESADRWQKVLNQINAKNMPPEDAVQPEKERKTEFLDALARTLVTARKVLGDSGGAITMRRLNRREYQNTIRDLLGVELDISELPADGGTGTFDTVGASLFMSSDQIEQYLVLGRRALDEHFAHAASAGQKPFISRVEAESFGNKRMNGLFKRTREMQDNYLRWTGEVDAAAERPENLAIAEKLREGAKKPRPSSGVPYATPMFFYHGWEQIEGAPSPTLFGFQDAQRAFFEALQYKQHFTYYEDYQSLPGRDDGAWLLFYQAYRETYVEAEPTWPTGQFLLRMRVAANEVAPPDRRFIEIGQRGEDVSAFTVISAHQVTGTLDRPQVIEVPVQIRSTGNREFALREKRPNSRRAEIRSYYDEFEKSGHGPVPAIWVDWFELEGPLLSPKNSLSIPNRIGEISSMRTIIESFTERAFRGRKPDQEFVDRLLTIYERRRGASDTLEEALKESLSIVLASPSFLYLHEPSSETGLRPLDSFELASRLSCFLWSAPPDDTLMALARDDRLKDKSVLLAQVDRMIDDERSYAFVSGFSHQWLNLDRLDFFQFDFKLHRAFDDSTKAAARLEVYHTLDHLVRNNQSLRFLLKSDFVIVNGLLANYYGLENVTGDDFRRVEVKNPSPRGGLLGMAAILAMGSNGVHTSPVERGAWVLRKLLHDPPPPAPPNVPQLARLDSKHLSAREKIIAHQEEPQCASCHRKIDPIGFGLENFDAAGKWRTEEIDFQKGSGFSSRAIDAAAAFHHGPSFSDFYELREIIATHSDPFARSFTESLIEYALGRPFGLADENLADSIIQQARSNDFALRGFLNQLITSDAFRSK